MPITRKPKPSNGQANSAQVRALIGRGGSPSRPANAYSNNNNTGGICVPIVVRIPEGQLLEIDRLAKNRPVRTPRHRWLIEAIYEKLVRERKQA